MIERLSPLAALAPFLRPYRLRILAALVALVVAAGATLTLPIAFRNLITNLMHVPVIADLAIGRALRDDIVLREYALPSR